MDRCINICVDGCNPSRISVGKWVCDIPQDADFREVRRLAEKAGFKISATFIFPEFGKSGTTRVQLFCSIANKESHKKALRFLIENNLIVRCENGELTDISFDYFRPDENALTAEKKYLHEYADLKTGEIKQTVSVVARRRKSNELHSKNN